MAPRPHAPRRKACQALLPDGTTPCSATFRGWGRYCAPHLEEHARLSGQFKDAAARAERLRAKSELSDKQVRAMAAESVVGRALHAEHVRRRRRAMGEDGLAANPDHLDVRDRAFAAAATIFGSTVVGVMPASRIGERPVRRVKAVSTAMRPSGSATGFGANSDQARGTSGSAPGVRRLRWPPRVAAAMMPTP